MSADRSPQWLCYAARVVRLSALAARASAALLLAFAYGCGSNPAASSSQQPASHNAKIRTAAELEASFGRQVHLVGTFKMKFIYGKDHKLMETWPVVVLDDGTEVMLGSFWDRERPNASSALQGRRVQASGRLHPEPPNSPGPQNLSFATLHPVDSLELPDAR